VSAASNRQFLLKRRPTGLVSRDDFEFREGPVPSPGPGEALVRNLFLSFDPSQRVWITDMPGYMPPVAIGEVVRADGIGQVIESNDPKLPVGALVHGLIGWQDYVVTNKSVPFGFTVLPPRLPVPPEVMLSVLGFTGVTAYFGLRELGAPKAGETVVISAASGAVGSIAGQIAKIEGCRVIGLAGSDEKCTWLTKELGFDVAVNYRASDWKSQLRAACPKGVDIDFENVGGEIMQAVFSMLNLHARVVLCGLIAGYNGEDPQVGLVDLGPILVKRVRIEGFIVLDYAKRFLEAATQLGQWLAAGKIKHHETIVEGLEHAPETLNRLFTGDKLGKLLLKIADAPIRT
jgi:NADPH-dependent curcumin reductase CurA